MKQLIVTFLFLMPFLVSAQGGGDRRKEIESYKIAFLTQKLELSAEEAKVFWPIYTDWQREQEELRKERSQKMISFRRIQEIEELSDSQVQTLIMNDFNMRQREINLDRRYYSKLRESLPIKVIGKFYRAQEAFKKDLLSKYRNGGRPQPN
jgi:hypothetical protein